MQITERPEWGVWVTPKLLRDRPLYRWYVYPHSYDKELVVTLLNDLRVAEDEWVWDPFLGAGTTTLACREYGCCSLGSDLLPLSILVTRAKIAKYNPDSLADQLLKFSFDLPNSVDDRFAPIPIVRKSLSSRRRRQISHLLNQIDKLPETARSFFRIALLRCVEDLALAVKAGGWLRVDEERGVKYESLPAAFRRHANQMLDDVRFVAAEHLNPGSRYRIRLGDARTIKADYPITACITSPPYLNRHDYTRVFALELALIGVASPAELISLRYRTLRSHVEARPLGRARRISEPLPRVVAEIGEEIQRAGCNDHRITRMVTGYFEDMRLVLWNIARNLRRGGTAALVVGNTRFSGVMIPVDEILAKIGRPLGLEPDRVVVARRRGNSAQQMGTFGREPARESVVFFTKARP